MQWYILYYLAGCAAAVLLHCQQKRYLVRGKRSSCVPYCTVCTVCTVLSLCAVCLPNKLLTKCSSRFSTLLRKTPPFSLCPIHTITTAYPPALQDRVQPWTTLPYSCHMTRKAKILPKIKRTMFRSTPLFSVSLAATVYPLVQPVVLANPSPIVPC